MFCNQLLKTSSCVYLTLGAMGTVAGWLLYTSPSSAAQLAAEVSSVNLSSTFGRNIFQNVTFQQTYAETPLVFALPTNQGANPSAIRITNVTTTGFDISQVEPSGEDGIHGDMDIQYLAITPGSHNFGGLVVEAGQLSTIQTVQRTPPFSSEGDFEVVNLTGSFTSAPAVLLDIQTVNNINNNSDPLNPRIPFTPWVTTTAKNITAISFDVALERSEVNDGFPVNNPETIGYLAISQGSGSFTDDGGNLIDLKAFISPDSIRGWDDNNGATAGDQVNFDSAFAVGSNPQVFASKATRKGVDGGWLRRGDITLGSVVLTIDEDRSFDNERNHTTEAASVVAFSNQFVIDETREIPEPSAGRTILALGIVTGFGSFCKQQLNGRRNK